MTELARHSSQVPAVPASDDWSGMAFRTSPHAILVTRIADGAYVKVNDGFCAISGYSTAEILGKSIIDVDPWADATVRAAFSAKMQTEGAVEGFEAVFRRKDGGLVDTLVSARLTRVNGQPCIVSVATDVSGLKSVERQVRGMNRVYTVLSAVNQALVRLREPQAIFDEACRVIVEEGGLRMAWVGLVDRDGAHVRVAASAGDDHGYARNIGVVLGDTPQGHGPSGRAISETEHVIVQDVEHDPIMAPWKARALECGFRASAAFPLIVNGRAMGAFTIYSGSVSFFDEQRVALLDELASDISFALEFAERETERREAEVALRESEGWLSESQSIARLGHYVFDVQKNQWEGSPILYDVLGVDATYCRDFAGWLETVHPDDRERMSRYFNDEVLGRHQPFDMEYRVMRPCDRAERWVHGLGRVEFLPDGQPVAMFGTIQDITERRHAEERYETVLNTAMDGFWLSDGDRVLEVNEAYCRMSGYTQEELLALQLSDLEVVESSGDVDAHAAKIREHGSDRFSTRHRRKDGTVFDVESSVQYQPDTGLFAAFQRDITSRKRREAYGAMGRSVLEILNRRSDVRECLADVVGEIRRAAEVDAVGIRLGEGADFPYVAHVGFPDGFMEHENSLVPEGLECDECDPRNGVALECTCGLVLSDTRDPALTPAGSFWTNSSAAFLNLPADKDPRWRPRNLCITEGFASIALVPIRDKDRVVGLIHLNDRRKGRLTLEAVELLEGLAAHLSEALTRKRSEAQLAKSFSAIVDVVAGVAELRDPYTAGHQRRVAELSVALAGELGMSAADIETLRIASLMHDVGKMAVPSEILSKPGVLSATEFELIKQHSLAGYQIIEAAGMGDETSQLIYQHHERCDGTGYPRGLSAGQILPSAKVLMVADVVEAMMSHRPYRAGLGMEAALAEIESGAGTRYDVAVSEACVRVFRERGFEFTQQ